MASVFNFFEDGERYDLKDQQTEKMNTIEYIKTASVDKGPNTVFLFKACTNAGHANIHQDMCMWGVSFVHKQIHTCVYVCVQFLKYLKSL